MTAGLRGILSGASIMGHPLDCSGFPKVCRGDDWGLLTRLTPGYMVAGADEERQRQTDRITVLRTLPGGDEFFLELETHSPPLTIAVVGTLPGNKNAGFTDVEQDDSAMAASRQMSKLAGIDWAPPLASRKANADWQHLARLLRKTSVTCIAIPPGAAAIDASIYSGAPVVARLDRSIFPAAAEQQNRQVFAAITTLVVSRESGTLARTTLAGPWGEARLLPADEFENALDKQGAVATQKPLFEASIPWEDQQLVTGIPADSPGQQP